MKHDNAFDQRIADTLHACADAVEPSPALRTRVMAHVEAHRPARRFAFRRSFAAVVAAIAVAVTGVVAAGTVVSTRGSYNHLTADHDYETLAGKAEDTLGEDVDFLEQIGGAQFIEGQVGDVEKLDDAGDVLGSLTQLTACYQTADGEKIDLYVRPHDDELPFGGTGTDATETREIGGIDVTYKLDHYIFAPVGYEPTVEEQAAVDAKELYLSTGSIEREEQYMESVSWEKDGVCYVLIHTMDGLPADALFEMAADMIG